MADFGGVLDIVGFDLGEFFFHVGGVVAALVDEDGAAKVVEGVPEESLVCEAKHEEFAGDGAVVENVGNLFDVGVRHVGCIVGI